MSSTSLIPVQLQSLFNHPSAGEPVQVSEGGEEGGSNDGSEGLWEFPELETGSLVPWWGSDNSNPLVSYRSQQISLDMRSVEIAASRTQIADGVMSTASILARRITIDLRVSSTTLGSFAESVNSLQDTDPMLMEDLLVLIKLLDQNTPEQFDAFFARLRNILGGDPGAQVAQREGATINLNASVPEEAETSVQVQSFFFHIEVSMVSVEVQSSNMAQWGDPLALDLDGDGLELTTREDGREFDLDADGRTDQTAFVTGGDAFLALDRNGNGIIDNGSELFGEHHGAANGFAELARFDDNGDGIIDTSDSVFDNLLLFDGLTTRSLVEAGIASISTMMNERIAGADGGNREIGTAAYTRDDGTSGGVHDVLLSYA